MRINPDTYVKLVHLDVTPEHQLTFNSLQDQKNFFDSLNGLVLDNFTYQRKDNIIRYPYVYDNVELYNYCVYCNVDYSDKYYYAYVTDLKYVNDNMTEIKIETDVFQTWQFDFIYKKSYIERKHVTDDIAGNYTIAEPVMTGEYVNNFSYQFPLNDIGYVVNWSELPDGTTKPLTPFGGLPSGGGYNLYYNYNDIATFIEDYSSSTSQTTSEAIQNIYAISRKFATKDDSSALIVGENAPIEFSYNIIKSTSLDGYVPVNKKLLTYPFCYLMMSNNTGVANILHYEKFISNDCEFVVKGIATAGCSIKCVPQNYGHSGMSNEEEGILAGQFPLLNFNRDIYADWLLTNSTSLNSQKEHGSTLALAGTIGAVISAVGAGIATGGAMIAPMLGAVGSLVSVASGIKTIIDANNTDYEHSLIPNSLNSLTNSAEINTASECNGFWFYDYSIKREFAEVIDNFFSMYGYKVNTMEVPNLHTRTNWNYLKILDPNVESDNVPEKDMLLYKKMLTNGITFWHDPSTFRDYSQSNTNI